MSDRDEFLAAARSQVNKGIYVWGAKGQDVSAMNDKEREKWIRRRESNDESNVKRVLALYEKRVKEGVNPILAFDCSGLVYWCNVQAKIGNGRRTADSIYHSYCIPVETVEAADLVFHHDDKKIVHVGIYVGNDTVVEAKGRDVGVVATAFSERVKNGYWNRFGRLKKLKDEYGKVTLLGDANCDGKVTAADAALILRYLKGLSDLSEQGKLNADYNQDGKITEEDAELIMQHIVGLKNVKVIGGSVYVRSVDHVPADKKENKASIIGVAHKGDTFPYRATAPSGWYEIDYKGKVGYISNREDLTKLE